MVEDQASGTLAQHSAPTLPAEEGLGLSALQRYWGMARSRWWVLVLVPACFLGAAVYYLKTAVPVYQARCRMLVEAGESRLLRVEDVYDPTSGGRSMDAFIRTQIQLMQTHDMLAQAFEELELAKWPEFAERPDPLGALRGGLSIVQEAPTFLVSLSYRSPNRDLTARVANAMAQFYVDKFDQDTSGVSSRGLEELRGQLRDLGESREKAREALIAYKEKNNLIDIEAARELLAAEMSSVTSARIEAQLQEAERTALFASLSQAYAKGDPQSMAAVANALSNPLVTAFRTESIRARAELPELLSRYGTTHVTVRTQNEIIRNFDEAAHQEIAVNLHSAKMECDRVAKRRALLDEEMAKLQAKSRELDRFSGEMQVMGDTLDAVENSYRMVLGRINEVELSASAARDQRKGSLSIRERARVPGVPVWPTQSRTRILAMAGGFGFAAAAFLNILLCLLNSTAKSSDEIQAMTGFPYLGNLPPVHRGEGETSVLDKPHGNMAESFRTICTSLRLSLTSRAHRCFAITSADQGEGKTFAAFNLALSLARDGMRVLFVEADMRRPRVRRLISQMAGDAARPGRKGLSSVLVGELSLEEASWEFPPEARLRVLLCGEVPPNPAELLGGERFDLLLREAHEQYDMVIIDTPPVLRVADSCIIAGKGVAILYVARLFRTPTADIVHGAQQLAMVSATVPGFLANEADLARAGRGYGYYRYGYYYRHGTRDTSYGNYGPGSDDKDAGTS